MKTEHEFIADMFNRLCSKECWSVDQLTSYTTNGAYDIHGDYYDENPDDIESFSPAYEPSWRW